MVFSRLVLMATAICLLTGTALTRQEAKNKSKKRLITESLQLHEAFTFNDKARITRLVKQGVSIDAPKVEGSLQEYVGPSLLARAVLRKDMAMIRFLVRSGASLSASTEVAYSPISDAMSTKDEDIIDFFLARPSVKKQMIDSQSLLHEAVKANDRRTVELFFARGADPNKLGGLDTDGEYRPLHYAAELKHGELVRYLISKGAQVDGRDTRKRTPLFRAVESGRIEAVKALVECGANVNAQDDDYETPLSMKDSAVDRSEKDHKACVDYLRSKGARN